MRAASDLGRGRRARGDVVVAHRLTPRAHRTERDVSSVEGDGSGPTRDDPGVPPASPTEGIATDKGELPVTAVSNVTGLRSQVSGPPK